MRKLWLVSALSLGLVLVAGCTTAKPVTITSSDDMIAIYNKWKAMTCTLTSTTDEWTATSTMYFKDWMISQVSSVTTDWETYNDYALARDGIMYGWWDSYGDGGMYLEYEMNIEDELGEFNELDDWSSLTCVNWVKDSSVFNKPADIEFTSLNDLFWGMEEYYEEYGDEYSEEENGEVVFEENSEENIEENVEAAVEETVE